MQQLDQFHGAGAFALALAATLVLAAYLTPRGWWRRPNARALAVLVGGTWGIGTVLLSLVHAMPPPAPSVVAARDTAPARPALVLTASAPAPALAGQPFRVHGDLNLRAGPGTDTARLGVVRSGAAVTPTGVRHGDWWQVRAVLAGGDVTGWTSSLWLRLPGEARSGPARENTAAR